jgi:hypothetical protein
VIARFGVQIQSLEVDGEERKGETGKISGRIASV